MRANQLRPGQDVLFTTNNQTLPGKIIRQSESSSEQFHILLFDDNEAHGTRVVKNAQYSESPRANTFHVSQQEEGRSVGSSR